MRFVDYLARADRDEVQNLFYQFFEQDDRNGQLPTPIKGVGL